MALTFAFIGNRADLGERLPAAYSDVLILSPAEGGALSWGVGFFQTDEVLLRRKPSESTSQVALAHELEGVKSHAILSHICQTTVGALRTETTPPLRFGHLVFACQRTSGPLSSIRGKVEKSLPDFLRSGLKGDTFTELAFSIFLGELPRAQLERTWQSRAGSHPSGPIEPQTIATALRKALRKLDGFTEEEGAPRFEGGLWVNTGEHLVVAHRAGHLGLRVLRERSDFMSLGAVAEQSPLSVDQAHFTLLLGGVAPLPVGWERIPDNTLITASRTKSPEIEAL